jgi:hypothetical protein
MGFAHAVRLAIVVGAALVATGCGSRTRIPGIATKGIVAWNYRPVANRSAVPPATYSIRIATFSSRPPAIDGNHALIIPALVPVVGLFMPPVGEATNAIHYPDDYTATGFLDAELENLVAGELRQSGLFRDVLVGDAPADLTLAGAVDIDRKIYAHYSGLGVLMGGIIPMMIFPMMTVDDACAARFVLTSTSSGQAVFSKDYRVRAKTWVSLLNADTEYANYGRELFPKLVAELLADLAAVVRARAA